ncbi:MAG TPA: M15 family metallopeptidase [Acidimicrobiales bacterium]|jgi:hypothetical protein|nr:M15 family metallopeptidase [Acidimicrobiales bacterium]
MDDHDHDRDRDRGQILPLVALLILTAGLAVLLLARLGGAASARAQARTAADAAALAGVLYGRSAAASVAEANGARLVRFEARAGQAFVRVTLGQATATARARRTRSRPSSHEGRAPAGRTGLAPALQAALARAAALLGRAVPVTSGYRSTAEQARLWARRDGNPYPVARPGSSAHERGLAVDVPRSFVPFLLAVARQAGLCQPYPAADPVHFELCAAGRS